MEVEREEEYAVLRVKVHAGAHRSRVIGEHDGALKVEVSAPPERGKANKAVTRLLAEVLGVSRSDVVILAGETAPRKRVGVCGISPAQMRARLEEAIKGES